MAEIQPSSGMGMETEQLLDGEVVKLRAERVAVSFGSIGGTGTLSITNYRLLFHWGGKRPRHLPLMHITKCADARAVSITIFVASTLTDDQTDEFFPNPVRQCHKIYNTILASAFPQNMSQVFAFSHRLECAPEMDGWNVFDAEAEFKRLGIPNSKWRVTHINHDYSACSTYPRKTCVPVDIRDWELRQALEFRTLDRYPCLTWKDPKSDASLCRSSQPLTGIFKARNREDEKIVQLIKQANPSSAPLYIVDSRPQINAVANTAVKGAGYEATQSYGGCEVVFLGVENIHNVRKSYTRLRELCMASQPDDDHWLSMLEGSRWLQLLSTVLCGAKRTAEMVAHERASVLIHCSDGWDRTPQISALAQLMVDPFYRTLKGFEVLVEKEWCSFGHKFAHRIGHAGSSDTTETSPIFTQFADCVYQMMRQFPTAFQFNEILLLELVQHTRSCRFGTFLYNSEFERRKAGVFKRTTSFWTAVNLNVDTFTNPHYDLYRSAIFPDPSVRRLSLWETFFFRDDDTFPPPQLPACRSLPLSRQVATLQKTIAKLEAELRVAQGEEPTKGSDNEAHEATVSEQYEGRDTHTIGSGETELATITTGVESGGSVMLPSSTPLGRGGWDIDLFGAEYAEHERRQSEHASPFETTDNGNGAGGDDRSGNVEDTLNGIRDLVTDVVAHAVVVAEKDVTVVSPDNAVDISSSSPESSPGTANSSKSSRGDGDGHPSGADDSGADAGPTHGDDGVDSDADVGQSSGVDNEDDADVDGYESDNDADENDDGVSSTLWHPVDSELTWVANTLDNGTGNVGLGPWASRQNSMETPDDVDASAGTAASRKAGSGGRRSGGGGGGGGSRDSPERSGADHHHHARGGGGGGGGGRKERSERKDKDKDGNKKSHRRRAGSGSGRLDGDAQPGGSAAHWVPDQSADHCIECLGAFSFINRRHHCRQCGRIYCAACSTKRAVVEGASEEEGPVRVCDRCYATLHRRRAANAGTRAGPSARDAWG